MRRELADNSYLWDMLNSARLVQSFVSGRTFEDYKDDAMLRSSIERQVEIIGEAARKVSNQYRDSHPGIPWGRIIAQRHILAHDYAEIDPAALWRVATLRIPELIAELDPLVPPPPSDPGGGTRG